MFFQNTNHHVMVVTDGGITGDCFGKFGGRCNQCWLICGIACWFMDNVLQSKMSMKLFSFIPGLDSESVSSKFRFRSPVITIFELIRHSSTIDCSLSKNTFASQFVGSIHCYDNSFHLLYSYFIDNYFKVICINISEPPVWHV